MEDVESNALPAAPDSCDWPLHARSRLTVLVIGLGTFLVFHLLRAFPGLVEFGYARSLGPFIVRLLSRLTGLLPFSLVEVLLMAYLVWLVVLAGQTARALVRRQRRVSNAALAGGLRLARDAGVFVALFYFLWGFNYARRPLDERLEWPEWNDPDVAALTTMTADAVDAANQAYLEIHETQDAGAPTAMPNVRQLDRALEQGWRRAANLLDLPKSTRMRYGPTKRLLMSHVIARFAIAGFYFPWTGEANVLRDSPVVSRAHSMAHEKAHQRGIGPESEASFLGFVAGALAPHPHARYSALVFAQGQLLRALSRADRPAAREIAARRLPGIRRDLADLADYWSRFEGIGQDIGQAVNDRYLRTQRVHGGIRSYGLSVRLLITFAAENNGSVVPVPDRPTGER